MRGSQELPLAATRFISTVREEQLYIEMHTVGCTILAFERSQSQAIMCTKQPTKA